MSERTADTIELGKGVKYAKVSTRVKAIHEDTKQCSIETSVEFKDNHALFEARVTTPKGVYVGHSLGKTNQHKAFEKLETIAIGRALSFAGYLASGEIASAEEMEDIVSGQQLNSLKLKYARVYADDLEGMDRPAKQQAFSGWCKSILDEEAEYNDVESWSPEWYQACWRELVGPDSDVPFEE